MSPKPSSPAGDSEASEPLPLAHAVRASAAIAMLACSLGCDELFELGYLVVDDEGIVRTGRATDSEALQTAVNQLVNGASTAHNTKTAVDFAKHARLVFA